VANLPFSADSAAVAAVFAEKGLKVAEVVVPTRRPRFQGAPIRGKGFAFVALNSEQDQQAAVEKLQGYELEGRPLSVSIAKPPVADAEESQ
jgi:RNA recognition motif-containing protein